MLADVGPEVLGPSEPDLAVAQDGAATVVWERGKEVSAASRPAAGAFGAAEPVTVHAADNAGPRVAVDRVGDATTVFELESGERVIASSTRAAGGKWSAPLTISEPLNVNVPSVAVDAAGDAAAIWEAFFEETGSGKMEEHIQVATRPAGDAAWGAPVTLTKTVSGLGEPGNQEVAIDGAGDAVVIWGRMHGAAETIESSQDRALAREWSPPIAISGPGKMEEAPQLAVNDAGSALVVWERQEPSGPELVEAAAGSAVAEAWQPARAVSSSTPGSEAREPAVSIDAQGDAAAVWADLQGGVYKAEAAGYDAAGPRIGSLSIPASGAVGQALSFSLASSDVWSPLSATTWSFGDGATATGSAVTHSFNAARSYTVLVSSADVLGNTTSASAAVTITGGPSRPALTGARLSHRTFRVGPKATAVSATRGRPAPLGTSFRFDLSEPAGVEIVFSRTAPGLRSGRKCLAPSSRLRRHRARRCTRTILVGKLSRAHEAQGADSIAFSGRIGRRALAPHSYEATLVASAGGLASAPVRLALTVVR